MTQAVSSEVVTPVQMDPQIILPRQNSNPPMPEGHSHALMSLGFSKRKERRLRSETFRNQKWTILSNTYRYQKGNGYYIYHGSRLKRKGLRCTLIEILKRDGCGISIFEI